MRNVCAKLVPKELTEEQKQSRVTICQDLLEREDDISGRVITGDETWVYQNDPEKKGKVQNGRQPIPFFWYCGAVSFEEKDSETGLVVGPVFSHYKNSRFQVDLIDMQSEPGGYYRFVMNYQDHLTKFAILHPLKSKVAEELACQLMDIFVCSVPNSYHRAIMAANLRTK